MHIWIETAGLGHVTRQLNLARALRELDSAISIVFFTDGNPAIIDRLAGAGEKLISISDDPASAVSEIREVWASEPPRLFLLDSATLHRNAAVRQLLKDGARKSVCIVDEIELSGAEADLIINALPGDPVVAGKRRVIRGAEFMIQDSDVASYHDRQKETPERPERGFAFFGGMDGNDFSSVFIEAIARSTTNISWRLLVGPLYKEFDRLTKKIRESGLAVHVEREVPSVAKELWDADIAVIAAGNTLSESVGVGTPCLCLAQTDEQSHNARYFSERTGAVFVGAAGKSFPYPTSQPAVLFDSPEHAAALLTAGLEQLSADRAKRADTRRRMLETIDGRGASRVASMLMGMLAP